MLSKIKRFLLRHRWQRDYELSLNRRAAVESELLECASGKRPLPDKEKCRELAARLGVPAEWKGR